MWSCHTPTTISNPADSAVPGVESSVRGPQRLVITSNATDGPMPPERPYVRPRVRARRALSGWGPHGRVALPKPSRPSRRSHRVSGSGGGYCRADGIFCTDDAGCPVVIGLLYRNPGGGPGRVRGRLGRNSAVLYFPRHPRRHRRWRCGRGFMGVIDHLNRCCCGHVAGRSCGRPGRSFAHVHHRCGRLLRCGSSQCGGANVVVPHRGSRSTSGGAGVTGAGVNGTDHGRHNPWV